MKLLKEVNFNSISNPPALSSQEESFKFPPLPLAQIRFIRILVRGTPGKRGRLPGDGLWNAGERSRGEVHTFDSEDVGHKGFKSITSIITKCSLLHGPSYPALCVV